MKISQLKSFGLSFLFIFNWRLILLKTEQSCLVYVLMQCTSQTRHTHDDIEYGTHPVIELWKCWFESNCRHHDSCVSKNHLWYNLRGLVRSFVFDKANIVPADSHTKCTNFLSKLLLFIFQDRYDPIFRSGYT